MQQVLFGRLRRLALVLAVSALTGILAGCPGVPTSNDLVLDAGREYEGAEEAVQQPPALEPVTVDVTVEGPGSVSQEAGGSFLTLIAMPDPGAEFHCWSGSIVCNRNPLTIYPTSSTSLRAHFVELWLDADLDGVHDKDDQCPGTWRDEDVDETTGCSCRQLDDDDDDVNNCDDECPNTPGGEPADDGGCSCSQLDDDRDGVSNCDDLCPCTPLGGRDINEQGCGPTERDTDDDGVRDHRDECPDTPFGAVVNHWGCPPVCGNHVIESGEECEPPDTVICDADCRRIPAVCGNGILEEDEECDPPDGITCDAACQLMVGPVCGNYIVEGGEECDPPDGVTCDNHCRTIADQGPITWNSTRLLFATSGESFYRTPETYDIGSNGVLTTAHVTPNSALIEAYCGGSVTIVSTNLPSGVETTVFYVSNLGGIPGERMTESATINTFTLSITGGTATWTFDYVLRERFEGSSPLTLVLEFAGEQTGTVSADRAQITWTGVSGTCRVCVGGSCQTYELQGLVTPGTWSRTGS